MRHTIHVKLYRFLDCAILYAYQYKSGIAASTGIKHTVYDTVLHLLRISLRL